MDNIPIGKPAVSISEWIRTSFGIDELLKRCSNSNVTAAWTDQTQDKFSLFLPRSTYHLR